jgi:hypothetical protein
MTVLVSSSLLQHWRNMRSYCKIALACLIISATMKTFCLQRQNVSSQGPLV